jgi:hypothetical protein
MEKVLGNDVWKKLVAGMAKDGGSRKRALKEKSRTKLFNKARRLM